MNRIYLPPIGDAHDSAPVMEGVKGLLADEPLVSIVMPVRNGVRWLNEAIASLLDQTLTRFELIIIDDGSVDSVAERLAALTSRDRRIAVYRQPRLGLVEALNLGLSVARAPYLARLDADDLAGRRRLERQAEFLNAHPQVGLVGTWTIDIDAAGRRLKLRKPPADPVSLKRLLGHGNPFVHSSVMARTDLVRRLGGYRAPFRAAEDYDLWLRMSEASDVANLCQPLTCYRSHSGRASVAESLRQNFSVRLAKRAAAARRAQLPDPTDRLRSPPDWRSLQDVAFAEDVALYQWLDPAAGALTRDASPAQFDELSHAERQLAAISLLARLRGADASKSRRSRALLLRLCRERPKTVISTVWSLRLRRAHVPVVWTGASASVSKANADRSAAK